MAYPKKLNQGEKLRMNGVEITINNSFILKNDELGEFYEIDIQNKKITIDKNRIYDFLYFNDIKNNATHILDWKLDSNKKFIQTKLPNAKIINILNYLTGNLELFGNRVFPVIQIRNDQPFNFRSCNIMSKHQKEEINHNSNNKINASNSSKFKFIPNPLKFFDEETCILQKFQGHIKELGQTGGIERNQYQLITLAKDKDIPYAPKYYEVFLNKQSQNEEEFTFIIDKEDISILSSIRVKNPFYKKEELKDLANISSNTIDKDTSSNLDDEVSFDSSTINYDDTTVKNEYIVINNPTWKMLTNQYIAMNYINMYKRDKILKTIYIHRYLLQDSITDENYTIDHINGNKFDNRRSNLRAANMSTQNMNRGNVKRKRTLASIINSFVKVGTDTPINLSFDNLEFIIYFCESVKTKKGITIRNGFSIEFKPARSGTSKGIEDSSTQAVVFKDNPFLAIKVKLAHAVCIRYLYTCKYDTILKHNIDNKPFANTDQFKSYTEGLITEIIGNPYTINSFMDYMISLKIMKYSDHRKTIGIPQITNSHTAGVELEQITFNYVQYVKAREKYDIDVPYGKDTTTGKALRLRKSGLGSSKETITDGDKKAFALVQRYNALVEIENASSTKGTLANITLEDTKFTSFQDLRVHTETWINKLASCDNLSYTLESFAEYITKKAANKKITLEVAKLKV
jgi:hypothetical protein